MIIMFDVDETLAVSGGPISISDLYLLRQEGNILGICGNWGKFIQEEREWHGLISMISCLPSFQDQVGVWRQKDWFLSEIKKYIPSNRYIMVGNIMGVSGASDDKGAADRAGWEFVKESDFAEWMKNRHN